MTNPFSLEGQVAIVTGGSKGIGLSISQHLAQLGAKVVVSSRKLDICEAVVADIKKNGGEAMAVACNISRREMSARTWSRSRTTPGAHRHIRCQCRR